MDYHPTMPVDTVFLDAGGVLLFPDWDRLAVTLRQHGVAAQPDVLARAELRAKRQLDDGQTIRLTSDRERGWVYFNLVLEHAGVSRSAATDAALAELQEYHARHNLWSHVPPEVPDALTALRSHGLRLVVVSNANGTLRALLDRLGLAPLIDVAIDSHEEGVEKPDPRLFQIALERSGASPERTIHVGDLYHVDVVGARAAGLRAVLFDPAGLYPDVDCPRIRSLGELVKTVVRC